MSHGLSKSKILYGLQCQKRLWLSVYHPDLLRQSPRALQSIQAGIEAQEMYRGLIPNGILVQHVDDQKAALEETRRLIARHDLREFRFSTGSIPATAACWLGQMLSSPLLIVFTWSKSKPRVG